MSEPALRKGQAFAIPRIIRAFQDGRRVVILHAPTGSGKSLVAASVAKGLGERAFLTSTQVSLVEQYARDSNVSAVVPNAVTVFGKGNYPCERDRLSFRRNGPVMPADEATCFELNDDGSLALDEEDDPIRCRHRVWRPNRGLFPDCPYYVSKANAEMADVAITTLAYFFHGVADGHNLQKDDKGQPIEGSYAPSPGWFAGRLSERPLLVIDEAHSLESEVVRYLSSKWTAETFRTATYAAAFDGFVATPQAQKVREGTEPTNDERAEAVDEFFHRVRPLLLTYHGTKNPAEAKLLQKMEEALGNLAGVSEDLRHGIPWVVRLRRIKTGFQREAHDTLEIAPVLAGPLLKRRLFSKARHILLMSGSFFGSKTTLEELGLLGEPAREVVIGSVFPPENGPIFKLPIARLNFQNRESEIPKVLAAVDRLMEVERGRGVVHTQSFANASALEAAVRPEFRNRLWVHKPSMDRQEFIQRFVKESEPGSVIASPSVTEGMDLPDELAEWCAFLKAPFASKQDERVQLRAAMDDGDRWYERQAVARTIQGRGRILRHESDTGRTYLMDANHIRLLNRWLPDLPKWFSEAIAVGDRTIDLGARAYVMGESPTFQPEDPQKYPVAPPPEKKPLFPSIRTSKGIDFAALLKDEKRKNVEAQGRMT